jgi:hypothetical protein
MTDILVTADPATGGGSSRPAFAVWLISDTDVTLIDCGTVKTNGDTHWRRMRSLSFVFPAALIKTFSGSTEVLTQMRLVVEGLPPTISGMGSKYGEGGFSNNGSIHLHHSVSVIATCLDWRSVDELAVITWKSWLKAMGLFESYAKGDMNDAVVIGLAYLCIKGFPVPEIPSVVLRQLWPKTTFQKLDKGSWDTWYAHMVKSRARTARDKEVKRKKKEGKK